MSIVNVCRTRITLSSIHHARKVDRMPGEAFPPRATVSARYNPHENPVERIRARPKNYAANTAVSWPGRLGRIHSFFRARSPDEMLATAVPWTSPWLPQGYEQNFRNAAVVQSVTRDGQRSRGR